MEIVETYEVHNPTLDITQPIRVLIDMAQSRMLEHSSEQRQISFLARDLGKFYRLSVGATKTLVKARCSSLIQYTGPKLAELSDHPNMKQVVLLSPKDALNVKPNVDILQIQALSKFIRGVVEIKREVSVEDLKGKDEPENDPVKSKGSIPEDSKNRPLDSRGQVPEEQGDVYFTTPHYNSISTPHIDSRSLASKHGRRHDNIIRAIRRELNKPDSKLTNEVQPGEVEKVTGKGAVRRFPVYHLTQRGMDILEKSMRSVQLR